MRIAVNTRFLLKDKLEGIGRFTHEILSRMTLNHPEHEFIFFFDRPFDKQFVYAPNVTPVVLFPPARHPFLYVWWFEWSVANALKKYKADLFFSTDGYNVLNTTIPSALVIHDLAWLHFSDAINIIGMKYHQYFVPRFINKATKLIAVSEYTKADIAKSFNINPNHINVVYNAPSIGFKPLHIEAIQQVRNEYTKGKPYLLYVGAMHPRKNISNLLKAYDKYRSESDSDMPLLVVGRKAWATTDIEDTFEKMQFKQDVIFTNRVSEDVLYKITASAYCMVYIPFFEGFGLPIVESMSCGVPVITSDCTSMPEVGGQASLLTNPNDINAIADAIIKITTNTILYQAHREMSIPQASKFNWDKSAEDMWKVLIGSMI
jgi:glycosyltransferase involved in cell wall biosynthesis